MFRPIEEIIEYFDEKEIHYRIQEREDETRLVADAVVDYAAFSVAYICTGEECDISIRIMHFVRFKEQDYPEILRVTNTLNTKYRYAKFSANAEAEAVTIEYDFPEKTEGIGEAAYELFQRLLQIAEEAYPEYMRAIWGSPKNYSINSISFRDIEV